MNHGDRRKDRPEQIAEVRDLYAGGVDNVDRETWGVLVWNMARGANARCPASEAWSYLDDLMLRHGIKVALLNEADVYTLIARNRAVAREGTSESSAFSMGGTVGRDFWTDRGVRKPMDRRRWSAAVLSTNGARQLGEDEVRARGSSRPFRRPDLPFVASRPGTWIAATVPVEGLKVACVALYGLAEELTDASVHTSLSEISPVFSDPNYKEWVLLGGDFNIGTALADGLAREQSRIVLERIAAYGMKDILAEWRQNHGVPRLPTCTCLDDPCLHVLTRLTPNREGERLPWQERFSPQVDYLFVSEPLFNRFEEVVQIAPEEWERYSDHRPIVAMFRTH